MRTHYFSLLAASFVLFMGAMGALSLRAAYDILPALPSSSFDDIVTGKTAKAFEESFADKAPAYDASRTLWGVVEYAIFRQGRNGVVLGRDGWLFSSEEFTWDKDASQKTESNLAYVHSVQDTLNEKNIPLLVALIPAKSRVFQSHLGTANPPQARKDLYQHIIEDLPAHNIVTLDLLPTLQKTQNSFLRTDTHWTPEGANLAATEIATATHRLASARAVTLPKTAFKTDIATDTTAHSGDLLRYVPLGKYASLGPAPDGLAAYTTTSTAATDAGLFDDVTLPITLVGTSYSADTRWHFADFLKQELSVDVLNAADPGQGPFTTMAAYLDSPAFLDTPPRLIIWEIPERYFPISQPVTTPKGTE